MKKASKFFIYFLLFLGLFLGWFAYKRHFYYFGDTGKCVTVWKKLWGKSIIVPGKYYGIGTPDNYVETGSVSYISLFWSKELPNNFIVSGENPKSYIINSAETNKNIFLKYEDKKEYYKNILYSKSNNKLKQDAEVLSISMREPYATDKKGTKL
ncbi:hypothetical protein [Chryseobacterium fistulae]|uniref:Uncharacterized protein n=1 Tax=Chryseobacterium fistulae TaxID=2675058 RepID=A0A6N4XQF4_9FLAO|nr:hypothetical protein [Chryseobacterium fistulae]CAA7386366.1 hypothetical protein CHRY9393_00659 [Chryseobacterium fistulae]